MQHIGELGGSARSAAKAKASREYGTRGGRPKDKEAAWLTASRPAALGPVSARGERLLPGICNKEISNNCNQANESKNLKDFYDSRGNKSWFTVRQQPEYRSCSKGDKAEEYCADRHKLPITWEH